MPLYAVIVFVVEDCQARLVIEFLQSLHCQTAVVLHIQLASPEPCEVVWLRFAEFSTPAPEGEAAGDVGGGGPLVTISPEPAIVSYPRLMHEVSELLWKTADKQGAQYS